RRRSTPSPARASRCLPKAISARKTVSPEAGSPRGLSRGSSHCLHDAGRVENGGSLSSLRPYFSDNILGGRSDGHHPLTCKETVMSSSRSPTRILVVLCVAAACWAFSFGLGAPLASAWLHDAGHGNTVVGLNTGTYYLGIALAAGLVPALMRRWGRGCNVLGMLLSGATVALFPWGGSLAGCFVLRVLNGVAGALSLIPLETLVNQNAPPERRARDFGIYAFCVALGWALGTLVGMQ